MTRAASMLRHFALAPRSIVITPKLKRSVMIPALMGRLISDQTELAKRRNRMLNWLEVAAPNAAVRLHGSQHNAFLLGGLRGL